MNITPNSRVFPIPKSLNPQSLQYIPAQILVFYYFAQNIAHVCPVYIDCLSLEVRRIEGNIGQQLFHDRVQPRAPMFSVPEFTWYAISANSSIAILCEDEFDFLGVEQRHVLGYQGVFRFREDTHEIILGKRCQLNPDREASLKFRNEVGGL